MGVAKTAPGEDVFGLTDAQIIDGLRGLVRKAENGQAALSQQVSALEDKAGKYEELRGLLKAIVEDEDN